MFVRDLVHEAHHIDLTQGLQLQSARDLTLVVVLQAGPQ